ncbi:MAG: IclR family transcriptional regulator [Nocardioides sp.]|uniref:IclR family transcriptional regulator n=1 Tax=Nocardioides sp. TaxID=35761 RepID=UPI0039E5FCE9
MTAAAVGDVASARRSVLLRGLGLLDAFHYRDGVVSLAELTRRSGLPKPTVLRLLEQLARWGAVERTADGYQLGIKLFMLGEKVGTQASLRDLAVPYLEDLYEATHENVNLGVLHGAEVLYLARVAGHRSSDVVLRVGDTLPAHSTSCGKALLAYAPQPVVDDILQRGLSRLTPYTVVMPGVLRRQLRAVVAQGYAVNEEETHRGVVSVAAPVLDADRIAVAAISVTAQAGRVDVQRLAPAVRTATLGLSRALARARGAAT